MLYWALLLLKKKKKKIYIYILYLCFGYGQLWTATDYLLIGWCWCCAGPAEWGSGSGLSETSDIVLETLRKLPKTGGSGVSMGGKHGNKRHESADTDWNIQIKSGNSS